jgi:hypothetical protein
MSSLPQSMDMECKASTLGNHFCRLKAITSDFVLELKLRAASPSYSLPAAMQHKPQGQT